MEGGGPTASGSPMVSSVGGVGWEGSVSCHGRSGVGEGHFMSVMGGVGWERVVS